MDDPRATLIGDHSEQTQAIEDAVNEFRCKDSVAIEEIFPKIKSIPNLKMQPEFMQNLFEKDINIIKQMIQWTLMPNSIAQRRKIKSPQQIRNHTFNCKQFLKDNWCFYECLFLYIKKRKLSFSVFLQFLKPQNLDERYFSQILVPFARYHFWGSAYLSESLNLSSYDNEPLGIMAIMSEETIDQFIKQCHYWAVYQFLTTAVLVGLEDSKQNQFSTKTIQKLFNYCRIDGLFQGFKERQDQIESIQEIRKLADLQQNIATTLTQLIDNHDPTKKPSYRAITIINAFVNSKFINYAIKELKECRWCSQVEKRKTSPLLSSSVDLVRMSSKSLQNGLMYSSQQYLVAKDSSKKLYTPQVSDEEIAESLLKILKLSVQIYLKIPKTIVQEQPYLGMQVDEKIQSPQSEFYQQMIKEYQTQIQCLLDCMPILNRIVYNSPFQATQIKFTSGQEIKQITFMKYHYFCLLYHCLVLLQQNDIKDLEEKQMATERYISNSGSKRSQNMDELMIMSPDLKMSIKRSFSIAPQIFSLDVEKLHVIQIIEKYLIQNRWNNIAHHMLEKICHALIVSRYDYVFKNIKKDYNKKLTDSFLAFLIQNFTEKDYIYLQTMRFTSQGNLHSIYNIAKYLAFTLKNTNQLVRLLQEFDPWMKFLDADLGTYEENAYKHKIKPSVEDEEQIVRRSLSQQHEIKIDEVQSIRQLIKNVYQNKKKWPTSQNKLHSHRKSMYESRRSAKMSQSFGPKSNLKTKISQLERLNDIYDSKSSSRKECVSKDSNDVSDYHHNSKIQLPSPEKKKDKKMCSSEIISK